MRQGKKVKKMENVEENENEEKWTSEGGKREKLQRKKERRKIRNSRGKGTE